MSGPFTSQAPAVPVTGVAAGVPFLAVPPESGPHADAPVVVAWHLLDPPRTEAALAASLPLAASTPGGSISACPGPARGCRPAASRS